MAVWSAVSDSGENDVDWVISGIEMMGVEGHHVDNAVRSCDSEIQLLRETKCCSEQDDSGVARTSSPFWGGV